MVKYPVGRVNELKGKQQVLFHYRYRSTSIIGGVIFMQKAYYLHARHLARSKKPHMCVCQNDGECMREISLNPHILIFP